MNLNEIAVFVKIVETGSFTNAATALEMPKSTVSTKLSSLEARLGVTLIRRTTRKLFITDIGKEYYDQCLAAIEQISMAENQLSQTQNVPHGTLKITAPVDLGAAILPIVIQKFNKTYPQIKLELILTDKTVDLISEGIDLAIRTGNLKDSSLIAKKIGSIYFAPFASSKYLKSNPVPKTPKDLKQHQTIHFSPLGQNEWELLGPKSTEVIKLDNNILINDLNLIKALTSQAMGIAMLPTFLCQHEVKENKLIRLLPQWKSRTRAVHFVYPAQKFLTPNVSAFIELAFEVMKKNFEIIEN